MTKKYRWKEVVNYLAHIIEEKYTFYYHKGEKQTEGSYSNCSFTKC